MRYSYCIFYWDNVNQFGSAVEQTLESTVEQNTI